MALYSLHCISKSINILFHCSSGICSLHMNIVDARKYNKLLSLIALLKIKTAGDVFKYRNVLWGPLAIFYIDESNWCWLKHKMALWNLVHPRWFIHSRHWSAGHFLSEHSFTFDLLELSLLASLRWPPIQITLSQDELIRIIWPLWFLLCRGTAVAPGFWGFFSRRHGADSAEYTFAVPFCLQGKLLSF